VIDSVEALENTRVRLSTVWKGLSLIVTAAFIGYQYDRSLVKREELETFQAATVSQVTQVVAPMQAASEDLQRRLAAVDLKEQAHGQSLAVLQALMDEFLKRVSRSGR
jgi:hypothetical protein